MNTDDIKIGETYNLRVEILGKNEDFIHARPIAPNGEFTSTGFLEILHKYAPSFVSIPSEIVNSQSSTVNKYDPSRLFKKGDKVQPLRGKTVLASEYGYVTFHELAGQYEVNEDEARGTVTLIVNGHACFVSAFALELVTPVEELEPYMVGTDFVDDEPVWNIYKDGDLIVGYTSSHPHAKAAAEAECDRLNEEYRKNHEND